MKGHNDEDSAELVIKGIENLVRMETRNKHRGQRSNTGFNKDFAENAPRQDYRK